MAYVIATRAPGGRVAYYQHTTDGRPILGPKTRAARFPHDQATKIRDHLAAIRHADPDWVVADEFTPPKFPKVKA